MADDPSADSPADADVREWSDETVRIQTYDPEWPRRFEQERDALLLLSLIHISEPTRPY